MPYMGAGLKCRQDRSMIISHLGKTQVAEGEPVIWPGFRIFEPVPTDDGGTMTRSKRKLNTLGNPPFDYTVDTLFDYPTILADKFGESDWRIYNRLCSVHVGCCPFRCWHCYNDAWPDEGDGIKEEGIGDVETREGKNLVELFMDQRAHDRIHNKNTNVLRITGGEPFCEAEFILSTVERIAQLNSRLDDHEPKCAVWAETNLTPFIPRFHCHIPDRYLERLSGKGSPNPIVVHPCFHGLSDAEIETTTGQSVQFDELMRAFERLVNTGVDVYPTIHANLVSPTHLAGFFEHLYHIDRNLPLRVALIEIDLRYKASKDRMRICASGKGSVEPILQSRHAVLYEWNRLIERVYGFSYGVLPRHLARLASNCISSYKSPDLTAKPGNDDPNVQKRKMLVLKSADRDTYRRHALTLLGLPDGFIFSTEYDTKWVSQNVATFSEIWETAGTGSSTPGARSQKDEADFVACYAEMIDRDKPTLYPLRTGSMVATKTSGKTTSFTYKVSGYPRIDLDKDQYNVYESMSRVFGDRTIAPMGPTYALLSPGFAFLEPCKSELANQVWDTMVSHLSQLPRLEKSVFCRITQSSGSKGKLEEESKGMGRHSRYVCEAMDRMTLKLRYRVPNYNTIATSPSGPPVLRIEVAGNNVLQYVGPERITLSKYDEVLLDFQCNAPDHDSEAEIRIWREDDPNNGPEFRLPVVVRALKKVAGDFATSIITLAMAGLVGFIAAFAGKQLVTGGNLWQMQLQIPIREPTQHAQVPLMQMGPQFYYLSIWWLLAGLALLILGLGAVKSYFQYRYAGSPTK